MGPTARPVDAASLAARGLRVSRRIRWHGDNVLRLSPASSPPKASSSRSIPRWRSRVARHVLRTSPLLAEERGENEAARPSSEAGARVCDRLVTPTTSSSATSRRFRGDKNAWRSADGCLEPTLCVRRDRLRRHRCRRVFCASTSALQDRSMLVIPLQRWTTSSRTGARHGGRPDCQVGRQGAGARAGEDRLRRVQEQGCVTRSSGEPMQGAAEARK